MTYEKNPEKPLDPLRKSNEEEYFRKQNAELANRLKDRLHMANSGIKDDTLAKKISDAGFSADSVRALFIIPVVDVAWADGQIQPEERETIMRIVEGRGIERGSEAFRLIFKWLKDPPDDDTYLKGKSLLDPILEGVKKSGGEKWILEGTRQVAEAVGGVFGFGKKISPEEEAVIQRIIERLNNP